MEEKNTVRAGDDGTTPTKEKKKKVTRKQKREAPDYLTWHTQIGGIKSLSNSFALPVSVSSQYGFLPPAEPPVNCQLTTQLQISGMQRMSRIPRVIISQRRGMVH